MYKFNATLFDRPQRVYTFAYIYVPVPLKGATGSPGVPLAVR